MPPVETVVLPLWVEYVKALGTPLVALTAACVAGVIAHRQWVTAKNKLKLDFFDRRMEIYKLAVEVLDEIRKTGMATLIPIQKLEAALPASPWLFDKALTLYLFELCMRAFEMHRKHYPMGSEAASPKALENFEEILKREEAYQGEKSDLDRVFSVFLALTH